MTRARIATVLLVLDRVGQVRVKLDGKPVDLAERGDLPGACRALARAWAALTKAEAARGAS